jgi:tetratricopeptide (TPR) repeat protein
LLGDHREALARCHEALELLQRIGDRFGEAETWDSLGFTYRQLQDWTQATACYERALDLYREFGDRYNEADTMAYLGDALHASGRTADARATWQQAVRIFEQLGHPDADRVRAKLDPDRIQTGSSPL